MTTEPVAAEAGRDFIRDIVQADLSSKQAQPDRDPIPAGAERLPAHRPRQVDCPEFRHRAGVRRQVPSALRRHQPDQGRAGIYRFHPGRRALARLRLGNRSLLRLGLFRAPVRLGGGPDQGRPRLCRRPVAGGNPRQPRHADGARQELAVPRPRGGRKPRPVPPHEGRRIPERHARAARQDRHGLRQHQPARPRALPHPACRASAHRHQMVDLSELRLRPRPVGRHRRHHAFDLHAGIRGPPAAL